MEPDEESNYTPEEKATYQKIKDYVKDVQTRLGHTNIETTLQTYVHDTEKMVERSVDLFEQVTQAKTS